MANDKEQWKQIHYLKGLTNKNYAVSTHGRLASYDNDINNRYILKLHKNGGFPMATIHTKDKSKALFVHHAMGAAFLKKQNPKSIVVIHLDYDKANNILSNLRWATKKEQIEHNKKSPHVLQSIARKVYNGATAKKLTEKKVILLKKEIWSAKRTLTLKQIAAKYGIAEMTLYRIKNGEMWFHVHVEEEPIFPKYKTQLKNIEYQKKATVKKGTAITHAKTVVSNGKKDTSEKTKTPELIAVTHKKGITEKRKHKKSKKKEDKLHDVTSPKKKHKKDKKKKKSKKKNKK